MGGLFNYDNPIWRFVGRIWDLFILNLLWVLCSLPIVTFGASTTAMYYCTMKIARDRDSGGVLSMFFHSFKDRLGTCRYSAKERFKSIHDQYGNS